MKYIVSKGFSVSHMGKSYKEGEEIPYDKDLAEYGSIIAVEKEKEKEEETPKKKSRR